MAHITFKYPLEFWWEAMLFQAIFVAAWLGLDKLYKKKAITKPYHGGMTLVLPAYGSAKHQEVLAAAIVWARGPRTQRSETAAIFIQKIREWTDYNTTRNKRDARPYYSYQEWCDHHFPAQNFASMQRLVKSLEKWTDEETGEAGLGLIITEQDASCGDRKRYAVDEAAVSALVDRWAAVHPEIARNFTGESRRLDSESPRLAEHTPRIDSESHRLGDESHTSSKKAFKPNALSKKDLPPHIPDAARLEPLASTKMKDDSDSHTDTGAADQPRQKDEMGDSDFVGPIPRSEAPLTQIDQKAAEVWAMVRNQLSLKDVEFKRWLQKSVLRGHHCADGVETYTVAVPAHAQDLLQHRYYRNVEREFNGLQTAPVKIEFEVG